MKNYTNKEVIQAGLIDSVEGIELYLKGVKEPIVESHHFMTLHNPAVGQMYIDNGRYTFCMDKPFFDLSYAPKKVTRKPKKK